MAPNPSAKWRIFSRDPDHNLPLVAIRLNDLIGYPPGWRMGNCQVEK